MRMQKPDRQKQKRLKLGKMHWRKAILSIWRHEKAIIVSDKKWKKRTCCGKVAPI